MNNQNCIKARLPLGIILATLMTHGMAESTSPSQPIEQGLSITQQNLIKKPESVVKTSEYPRYSTDLQQAIELALANPKLAKSQKISVMIKSTKDSQEKLIKQLKKQGVNIQSSMIPDTVMAIVNPQILKKMAKSPLIVSATMQVIVYASVAETHMTSPIARSKATHTTNVLASTDVALNLLKRAASSQPNTSENIIFSPWSIIEATTAVMLANDDKTQIKRPNWLFPSYSQQEWLKAYAERPVSTNFRSKNYLWLQEGSSASPIFKASYEKELAGHVEALDFGKVSESVKRINQQVATDTEQKITDLLSDKNLVPTPVSILTNAVYFKAPWQSSFLAESTKQEDFHNANGKAAKVPMMSQTQQYKLARVDKWTLLEIPFKDNTPEGLWLMLPPKETPLALPTIETITKLEEALSLEKISLKLPKIKLSGKNMDLKTGILPEIAKWQLTQLIQGQSLPIGNAIHKAAIEWDEVGATAAAATAYTVAKSISFNTIPEVIFNRPFVFMIRQQQNTLFAGQIRQLP